MLVVLLGFGLLVVTRAVQRCFFSGEQFITLDECVDRADLVLREEGGLIDQESVNVDRGHVGVYDFSTILKLIDLVRTAKDGGRGYDDFAPRRRKVDASEVKTLLEALLRERETLRMYIWNLKGHSKVGIPPRRYRALLYYTEVLDSMVSDLRELAHR